MSFFLHSLLHVHIWNRKTGMLCLFRCFWNNSICHMHQKCGYPVLASNNFHDRSNNSKGGIFWILSHSKYCISLYKGSHSNIRLPLLQRKWSKSTKIGFRLNVLCIVKTLSKECFLGLVNSCICCPWAFIRWKRSTGRVSCFFKFCAIKSANKSTRCGVSEKIN